VSVLVVTGTGPAAGAALVAAAVAGLAAARGSRVAVVLPAQTGLPDGVAGELTAVGALAGVGDLHELARYPDALSPAAAARAGGRPPLDLGRAVDRVLRLVDRDLVLVLGVGGLLVRYDDDGLTVADLARSLRAPVLVAARTGEGAANEAALTLSALAARGLALEGVVVTGWPAQPTPADRSDARDLETLAARPLLGALSARAGTGDREAFLAAARAGVGPHLGGTFDVRAFRAARGDGPVGRG
jgi:dethiobiotin synthetase